MLLDKQHARTVRGRPSLPGRECARRLTVCLSWRVAGAQAGRQPWVSVWDTACMGVKTTPDVVSVWRSALSATVCTSPGISCEAWYIGIARHAGSAGWRGQVSPPGGARNVGADPAGSAAFSSGAGRLRSCQDIGYISSREPRTGVGRRSRAHQCPSQPRGAAARCAGAAALLRRPEFRRVPAPGDGASSPGLLLVPTRSSASFRACAASLLSDGGRGT